MTSVSLFLLTIAAIFIIGVVGELVFDRTGVPDVVWLIVVGIILGPVTGLVQRQQLNNIAPYFGALTLVIVLFDGGSKLRLGELSRAAVRGLMMALMSFVLSVAVVTPASMAAAWVGVLPESWTWLHGLILGAILGGPSSVVIMPALNKARLAARLTNVINLESALTDVLCVVVTAAAVQVAVSSTTDVGKSMAILGRSFGIGLGFGVAVGLLALLALKGLKKSEHAYPIILGTLLVLYVVVDNLGGSAALAILAVAVIVGNASAIARVVGLERKVRLSKGVESTHQQITFIVKSFFFTLIGAMLGPPWSKLALGLLLGLALLGARLPAVWLASVGMGVPRSAKALISVTLPRGMAAGVLAMVPAQAGLKGTEHLPVVVFAAVFTTVILFAAGFPVMRRRVAKQAPQLMQGDEAALAADKKSDPKVNQEAVEEADQTTEPQPAADPPAPDQEKD